MRFLFFIILLNLYSFAIDNTNLNEYFDNNTAIMFLIDPKDGSIIKANKSAASFYGYTKENLEKMKIQEINTFTKEQIAEEMNKAKTENRNYFIFRHKLANKEIKRVEVYSHPIIYKNKKVLFSIIHDVSNLELARKTLDHYSKRLEESIDLKAKELIKSKMFFEKMLLIGFVIQFIIIVFLLYYIKKNKDIKLKLSQSKDELNGIIQSLPIAIVKANKHTHKIGFFNNAFKNLFKWDYKDIKDIDTWFLKAYPETTYRDTIAKKWQQLVDETHNLNIYTSRNAILAKIRAKDDSIKTCYVWYHYNDNDIFGIFYDITKELDLEQENQRQQKILQTQSKIAAVGEMLGNIAHQWRQPLTIITSQISALKVSLEFHKKIEEEQLLTCIDEVMKQSKHLSQTIDDFKNFFSSDHESIQYFNISQTIKKVNSLISDSFNNNYIKIITTFQDIMIKQNENQLIQAILNICNNAKDAMVINNVATEERYFFINIRKERDFAIIEFTDSGLGIDEKIFDKIFEPYFTTKHQSMGTGIGLYMTYQIIIKNFEGAIEVKNTEYTFENTKLKGAQFTLRLPLDKK